MSAKPSPSVLLSCAALGLACAASPVRAEDAARASFDRMLAHQASSHVVTAPAQAADPLVALLVAPLRDRGQAAAIAQAVSGDPIVASFARMLAHEPARVTPPVPAGEGPDPLIAAMVRPLLETRHYTVIASTKARPEL